MGTTRYPQFCALARAAEILGERWTLLIVRELMLGPKRFSELRERLHGITPAMLSGRLRDMGERGLVRPAARPGPARAAAYELTEIGAGLEPAVFELIRWGGAFLFPKRREDQFEPDWALLGLRAIARRSRSPKRRIQLRIRHQRKQGEMLVTGGARGTTVRAGSDAAEAMATLPFDVLLRVLSGALEVDEAIAKGQLEASGSLTALRDLPMLFELRR
jgi:DNA-binding HxlR family transcriptional regulator